MNLDRVASGRSLPDDFNVIIEIPMNAGPLKYEVDKDTGALFVDRFMMTAMHSPAITATAPIRCPMTATPWTCW
jgi:inorganic pyrophosphatase